MKERILIPMDGTNVGEAILPKLESLVLKHIAPADAEIFLLRVNPIVNFNTLTQDKRAQLPYTPEDQKAMDDEAKTYLKGVADQLKAKGYHVTAMVKTGPVAEEIVKAANEARVNLIAMSTHGRTGFLRWAIGSISETVIRLEGKIPVLAVHAGEKERSSVLPMGSLQSLIKNS